VVTLTQSAASCVRVTRSTKRGDPVVTDLFYDLLKRVTREQIRILLLAIDLGPIYKESYDKLRKYVKLTRNLRFFVNRAPG